MCTWELIGTAQGDLEWDGVSGASFTWEALAAELPQVLPVSSHSWSAQHSTATMPELGRSPMMPGPWHFESCHTVLQRIVPAGTTFHPAAEVWKPKLQLKPSLSL